MGEQAELLASATAADAEPPANIFDLLRKRHPPGEWAFMEEVAPRPIGGRYADAVAVNLWSSRGHTIHGFEVKVSRSDWLRELKQPAKAEALFRYCNYWFLVAEKDVVKPGELPDTWGHLERRGRALYVVKAAPKLKPQAVSLEFFASLMRRGHEQIEAIAGRKYQQALNEARAEMQRRIDDEVRRRTQDRSDLARHVEKFEAETGLKIDRYSGPPIKTVKLAQRLAGLQGWKDDGALGHLADLATQLERAASTVRDAIVGTGLSVDPAEDRG